MSKTIENIGATTVPTAGYSLLPQREYTRTAAFVDHIKKGELDIGELTNKPLGVYLIPLYCDTM